MHMRTEVMTAALLFAGVAVFAQMPGRSGVAGYQRANTSRGTGALNASPKTTAVGLKPAVSAFNRIARTEEAAAKSRAPKTSPAQTKIGALGNRNYHTTSAEAKRDRLFNAPGRVNPTAKPGTSRTADKPGVGIIAPGAVSYTQSGDSVFGSNGTTYTRSGDTVFGSDGHTATRMATLHLLLPGKRTPNPEIRFSAVTALAIPLSETRCLAATVPRTRAPVIRYLRAGVAPPRIPLLLFYPDFNSLEKPAC